MTTKSKNKHIAFVTIHYIIYFLIILLVFILLYLSKTCRFLNYLKCLIEY